MTSDEEEPKKRRPGTKGRVTLTFQGPPLQLPGEDRLDELALDTSDLDEAREEHVELESEAAAPPSARVRRPTPGHDAWTRDRIRRGSDVHSIKNLAEHSPPPSRQPAPPSPPAQSQPTASDLPTPAGRSDALGLVERKTRSSSQTLDLRSEMNELFALGDFTGALRVAELLLGHDPTDPDAERTAAASRAKLEQLYTSRFGTLARIPVIAVPASEVRWLGLDNRAGFLLSRVDGAHSVEQIVDMSGMPRLEALKLLVELLDARTIRV